MAKDDDCIMLIFKDLVSTRISRVTYYEMDSEQVSVFNNKVLNVKRNTNPNDFPDFVGEQMYVEVFNVFSSRENRKGSQFSKEENALEKRMEEALRPSDDPEENRKGRSFVETLEYKNHSYDFWLSSLKRNIANHKESRRKYSADEKESVFLAHYTQKVLSYKDENGNEQWHSLGDDRKALSIIADELDGLIDYFVLFNDSNSEAEVIPISLIPSYLNKHIFPSEEFYPREGAGMIRIGLSDTIAF